MRHDYIRLDRKSLVPDKNGFLNLEVHAATIGVYKYRRQDGTIRRELRLPEEVFSEKSMASFARKPLTIEHRGGLVNSATVGEFTVGATGDNVRQDGKFLTFGIGVHKKEAVKSVMDAKTLGISPGYDCDIEEVSSESGKYPEFKKYGKYDCIQRNIEANHVTLTATPRGDGCNIRLDSGDALQIEDDSKTETHSQKETMTIKNKIQAYKLGEVHLDSVGVEYPQEAEPAVQAAFERIAKVEDLASATKEHLDAMTAERDGLKSQVEEKDKELAEQKARLDSSIQNTDIMKAVKDRVELENIGRFDSKETDSLTNDELKKKILEGSKRFDSAKLEGAYLEAAWDQYKAVASKMPKAEEAHFDSFEDLNNKKSTSQADRAAMVN